MDAFQEIGETLSRKLVEVKPHQYKLLIPHRDYQELVQMAEEEGTSLAELLRRAIKLFLVITRHLEPGAQLIIKTEGNPDKEIIVIV